MYERYTFRVVGGVRARHTVLRDVMSQNHVRHIRDDHEPTYTLCGRTAAAMYDRVPSTRVKSECRECVRFEKQRYAKGDTRAE